MMQLMQLCTVCRMSVLALLLRCWLLRQMLVIVIVLRVSLLWTDLQPVSLRVQMRVRTMLQSVVTCSLMIRVLLWAVVGQMRLLVGLGRLLGCGGGGDVCWVSVGIFTMIVRVSVT